MFFHQAADVFPMMDAARYKELLADIEANGQREEITICDGRVLDGRNRYNACAELGIKPKTRDYDGDPWTYAWSLNGNRRDLPEAQRGAIKIKIDRSREEWIAEQEARAKVIQEEANRKRAEAAKAGLVGRASTKNEESLVVVPKEPLLNHEPAKPIEPPKPAADPHKGRAARAAAANVSTGTQAKVEWIANKRPDLLDKVATGEIKATEAIREMKKDERKERYKTPEMTDKEYRVVYADPPWKYNDKCEDGGIQGGGVEVRHYDTMSIPELCNMELPKLEADAVLFLWTTSPFLEDCFKVVNAWGFKYKSSFVWDKIKHNMGHYNSVRHEILLVCVKGSCTPDVKKLFDSVQSIEKTDHSKKPVEFYEIIETLYTSGNKIEIFARNTREGWDSYGNEVG